VDFLEGGFEAFPGMLKVDFILVKPLSEGIVSFWNRGKMLLWEVELVRRSDGGRAVGGGYRVDLTYPSRSSDLLLVSQHRHGDIPIYREKADVMYLAPARLRLGVDVGVLKARQSKTWRGV